MVIITVDVAAPMCVMAHWGVVARLDVVTGTLFQKLNAGAGSK